MQISKRAFRHLACLAVFVVMTLPAVCRADEQRVLFQFDRQADQDWRSVNDNVMGGVSTGRFTVSDDATFQFFGRLSLANNGGFASVRSSPRSLGLDAGDLIHLRIRGDGRKYFVDLRVPTSQTAFTYRVSVQTVSNEWQEFRIPLTLFKATSFGRVVSNSQPLVAGGINSIGFTISDKRPGAFKLHVAWIKAVRPAREE